MDQELVRTLSDIVRRIDRLSPIVLPATRIAAQTPVEPYWYCERGNTLAALSGDWDTMFDAEGVTKYNFRVPSFGYLRLHGDTTTYPIRGMMAFYSENDGEAQGFISNPSGLNVQLKINGDYTDYTASAAITVPIRAGENIVRFAHDGAAGSASLELELFPNKSTVFLEKY